ELKLTLLDTEGQTETASAYFTVSTSYSFVQLQAGRSYQVTVRARLEEVPGGWSNPVRIDLPTGMCLPGEKGRGNGHFYDLMGRPQANPRRGIYIQDGRKYLKR
ncbi:MAG: fibronectin type III domain-containing protein, partial [Bacteroidaceae bacterium]